MADLRAPAAGVEQQYRAEYMGTHVGFVPPGLGSAIFALLLMRPGNVPRTLAACGVVASMLLAIHAVGVVIAPEGGTWRLLLVPILVYAFAVGLCLLLGRGGSARRAIA